MGIAERKQREKLEMRQRILNGARKVFLQNGYEQASVRNIASEISYSTGVIYLYFRDKGGIFRELHKEGFSLLLKQLHVLDSVVDPFERLKAFGRVFIHFAQENKDYYNLMFLVEEPLRNSEESSFQIAKSAISHLHNLIKECQDKGWFKDMEADYFSFMFLSAIHGICALFCKDRTVAFANRTPQELMENGYACLVNLLDKG